MSEPEETLAPTEWRARSAIVDADFSHFNLWWQEWPVDTGDDGSQSPGEGAGIMRQWGPGGLQLLARAQNGELRIRVGLHHSRPDALGAEWVDVAESSVPVVDHVTLSGFDFASGWSTIIPLFGGPHRVRYGIASGDGREGDDEFSGYWIDIWPEAHSDPELLSESDFGRFWNRSHAIEIAERANSAALGGDLDDLFERFVRSVFELRPDLRADAGVAGYWRDTLVGNSLAAWPRQFEPGQREAILDRVLPDV
jgi:hypothetical protein